MSWPQLNGAGNLNSNRSEDAPSAKQKKLSLKEQTEYSNLTRYSNEKCLYCCQLFFNKLQLYMHNTRHLYIPVEKQELSESAIEFLKSSQNLVPDIITEETQITHKEKTVTNKKTTMNKQIRNVGFKKMLSKAYRQLQDKKEKTQALDLDREILNHKDNLLKDLMTDCKVNLGENIPFRFIEKDTKIEKGTSIEKGTTISIGTPVGKGTSMGKGTALAKGTTNKKATNQPENSILSNFTTNCIVNLNDFFSEIQTDGNKIFKESNLEMAIQESKDKTFTEAPINNILLNKNITVKRIASQNNELNKIKSHTENKIIKTDNNKSEAACKFKDPGSHNVMLLGKKVNNFSISEDDSKSRDLTVAYYKLVKEVKKGVSCRICSKHFSNRYEAIVHESRHIVLKIPRLDKKLHHCICQKKNSKHTKLCLKLTKLEQARNANYNDGNKINTKELKKERIAVKKEEKAKLSDKKNQIIDLEDQNTDFYHQNTDLYHQNIDLDHQNIDLDNQTIEVDSSSNSPKKTKKKRTKIESESTCHYCNSSKCGDRCSVIRSDVMKSGDSTYFCKECFHKMEANLTKVGMYNGQSLDRRCVVCNCVGCQFVLAFMTAECVLGI